MPLPGDAEGPAEKAREARGVDDHPRGDRAGGGLDAAHGILAHQRSRRGTAAAHRNAERACAVEQHLIEGRAPDLKSLPCSAGIAPEGLEPARAAPLDPDAL